MVNSYPWDGHVERTLMLLFVNASSKRDGNTTAMAERLLAGTGYETLHLIDHAIHPRGSSLPGDQWPRVWERMCAADALVWGTPVYWHGMTGALKTVIERMNDEPAEQIAGTPLAFFFQGSGPGPAVAEVMHTTIERLTELYRMPLLGIADGARGIPALRRQIARNRGDSPGHGRGSE
jgi:possible flavodoxin protein